jgi:hypothetical protein
VLELLDYNDQAVSFEGEKAGASGMMFRPTTLDEILKTIPMANAESSFLSSSPENSATKSLRSLTHATSTPKSMGFGKLIDSLYVSTSALTKKPDSSSNIELKQLKSPQQSMTRKTLLPQFLRKELTGRLTTLSLSSTCKSITDLLTSMSVRISGLTRCNLSNCTELEDRAVIILAANCGSSLRVLSLNGCVKITDESIVEVGSYCARLEFLDLSRTKLGPRSILSFSKTFERDNLKNEDSKRYTFILIFDKAWQLRASV